MDTTSWSTRRTSSPSLAQVQSPFGVAGSVCSALFHYTLYQFKQLVPAGQKKRRYAFIIVVVHERAGSRSPSRRLTLPNDLSPRLSAMNTRSQIMPRLKASSNLSSPMPPAGDCGRRSKTRPLWSTRQVSGELVGRRRRGHAWP